MRKSIAKPRFQVDLPIEISGTSNVKGTLVNISKTGAKVKFESSYTRCLDSYLSFYIYLDGSLPHHNYSNSFEIGKTDTFEDMNRIKIVSKVVRYAREEKDNCWGIEFVEPEGTNKIKFHKLLTELEQKNTDEILAQQGRLPFKQEKGFTLRFSKLRNLIDFLPNDLYGTFFIPTRKPRSVGSKAVIHLIHPETHKRMDLIVFIEEFGFKIGGNQQGVSCSIDSIDKDLIQRINIFIGVKLY